MLKYLHLLLILALNIGVNAQNLPLEHWNVHVPYSTGLDVAISTNKIWGALEASIISVDMDDFSINKYTKANGLSDVNVAAIAYEESTDAVIVAYKNGNIDIIEGKSVTNLPMVKNATIIGSKTINKIHTNNGFAWLACGFGIVKVDIRRKEISDTYFVGVGNSNLQVNDVWANESFVFAATEDGVMRGIIDPFKNLSNADDTTAWKRYNFENNLLPETASSNVVGLNGKIYASINDEIFSLPIGVVVEHWTRDTIFSNWQTTGFTSKSGLLYISQEKIEDGNILDARLGTYDGVNTFMFFEDNGQVLRPKNIDVDANGRIWYADNFRGLVNYENNLVNTFAPNGPFKTSLLKMRYREGSIYVASSNLNPALPSGDDDDLPNGIYIATEQNWLNLNQFNSPILQNTPDIGVVEPILSENKLFIGTDKYGIAVLDRSDGNGVYMQKPPNSSDPYYRCIAATTDANNNLWFTNAISDDMPLGCRKPGGDFLYFTAKTGRLLGNAINDIVVDEFNQLWISTSSGGLFVYDYNNTIDDESDDELKQVSTSFGLPSSDARCLVVDQDGEIWIGTTQGVGVVFCPGAIFDNTCPVDRICIPRQDTTNFCDNLLENELVTCLAVDPANRKWIGTNGGIFLQSADGLETIYNFTEDNSPLLSNVIRSIAVDEKTGDVYIGTSRGINTFRAEAVLTDENSDDKPYVYPNPVRPEYRGPIAIRNLANNSNVKIMDVAGHVVFETQSTGGQAVWDGLNVDGDRVQTGVYIVLNASDDGKVKRTAKFVYVN